MNNQQQKLPIASLQRIDDACADFENVWQRGSQPGIEPVLETPVLQQSVPPYRQNSSPSIATTGGNGVNSPKRKTIDSVSRKTPAWSRRR